MASMRIRTPLLIPPTLEEVQLRASKIGLPALEAEKFWCYYESIGWTAGRAGHRMKQWTSSLRLWQIRWREEVERTRVSGATIVNKDTSKLAKEVERI